MKSPLKEDTKGETVVNKDNNTKLNEIKEDLKTNDNHHKSNSTINNNNNNQNISKNELQEKNPSFSANKSKIKISLPVSSSK